MAMENGYGIFPGFFSDFPGIFFQKSVLNAEARKQASKQASQQASKQASKWASKPASQQASKEASQAASQQASKQRKARKGRVYFLCVFCFCSLFSSLAFVASVDFVGWAFVALPFFMCLPIYLI